MLILTERASHDLTVLLTEGDTTTVLHQLEPRRGIETTSTSWKNLPWQCYLAAMEASTECRTLTNGLPVHTGCNPCPTTESELQTDRYKRGMRTVY